MFTTFTFIESFISIFWLFIFSVISRVFEHFCSLSVHLQPANQSFYSYMLYHNFPSLYRNHVKPFSTEYRGLLFGPNSPASVFHPIYTNPIRLVEVHILLTAALADTCALHESVQLVMWEGVIQI